MSDRETSRPTPRMSISESKTPAPPWTGVKFKCDKCGAVYQLEAADHCTPRVHGGYFTPACRNCGRICVIIVKRRN